MSYVTNKTMSINVYDNIITTNKTQATLEMAPKLGEIDFEKLDTTQLLTLYKRTLNLHNRELKSYAKLLGKLKR